MMLRQTPALLALALLLFLPVLALAEPPPTAAPPPQGWTTVLSEDFEGAFPYGLWHIGREGDPYLWGQRFCNPHSGLYSMWGGGGGSQGAQVPCTAMYTTGYVTTLSYGPLDLTGCTDMRLNFAHWTQLGAGDTLGVGYSVDGKPPWLIVPIFGNAVAACGGWCVESFTQDRWNPPACGNPRVYLLFRFASDAQGASYGTFVDDVSLDVYYGLAAPTATPTATPAATGTRTATATRTGTATRTATVGPSATRTPTWRVRSRLFLPVILAR